MDQVSGVDPDAHCSASARIDYRALAGAWADVSTVVDADGIYRHVSGACRALSGWEPGELEGHREDDFVHPDDRAALRTSRAEHTGDTPGTATFRFRCRDDSWCWVEATSRRVRVDAADVVVSTIRDITERQKRTMALEQRASTDPLTGVANRNLLMDRLRQGLRRLGRGPGVLAVLYLDLDRFKVINDSLGHRVCDGVLLSMASRLAHHLRPADTLARLGGDEFVIVAEGVADEAAAVELAERIIEAGREPFEVGDEDFVCTVSVGIASTADSQRAAEDLLHEADLALYRAKDRGRDRAEVFNEALRAQAVGRLVTERMVRRAIDEDRIVVEYQPIVDLRSGSAVSAEALVRIFDPAQGLVAPEFFLDAAEESGLLIAIDERVLADAVRQAAAWRVRLPGTDFEGVAINVTARHLADAGFHETVIDMLDTYDVPHSCLQIEVTERILMEASNSAMSGLRALRDAGVHIGLDDFGTGFSSLGYLRQFPLDFIKIDKLFVDDLEHDHRERAVTAAIIVLSHALDLTVVAEGVQTPGQRRVLLDLNCDRAQGFLFARSGEPSVIDGLVALSVDQPV
jgi:diguanylate cyclase (GGDEF)-like protein/PAS domain S-box-containing protein